MNTASSTIIALGLLGSAVMLQATPDHLKVAQITADRLSIVDGEGQVRITLEADGKETGTEFPLSGLTLYDTSGRRVAILAHRSPPGVAGTQPMLVFYDPSGEKQQTALYQTVGQSLLALRDSTNTNSITVGATSKMTSLKIWHRTKVGTAEEKLRRLLTLTGGNETGSIEVGNSSGRRVWTAP